MLAGSSCPLILLVKVGWMRSVALGSEVDKVMASGLLQVQQKEETNDLGRSVSFRAALW